MNEKVNLSAPWEIFYRELQALFRGDGSVNILRDDDEKEIDLLVEGAGKRRH